MYVCMLLSYVTLFSVIYVCMKNPLFVGDSCNVRIVGMECNANMNHCHANVKRSQVIYECACCCMDASLYVGIYVYFVSTQACLWQLLVHIYIYILCMFVCMCEVYV